MTRRLSVPALIGLVLVSSMIAASAAADPQSSKKAKKKQQAEEVDPFKDVVFPPPPNTPRIKLERILTGRADIESGGSSWKKVLIGASPQAAFDTLVKPLGVAFDREGRVLVTDWETHALVRFDLENDTYDVFGTLTSPALQVPMSVDVGPDGTILVADSGLKTILALDSDGKIQSVYGQGMDLRNPTDAVFSPDGKEIYVADSEAQMIHVFDTGAGTLLRSMGGKGSGPGQFAFPTSVGFDLDGNLVVVDQLNTRVQVVTTEGEYVDEFGNLGTGFGSFVRPKHVVVDEVGFIYVTDAAFSNFQIFDVDYSLLAFVGEGGQSPGQFRGISGIDIQGDKIVVADSLNSRVQVFRYLVSKTGE